LGIGDAETEEKEDGAGAGVNGVVKKSGPGASGEPVGVGMSGRRTIQELVAELDPRVTVDAEMESVSLFYSFIYGKELMPVSDPVYACSGRRVY
jgi:hypothetical protein